MGSSVKVRCPVSPESVELSLSGFSEPPLLPHAPGSLYGSVPCILLLEKGVKCKGHYYCSFKVSENPVMFCDPVLGT